LEVTASLDLSSFLIAFTSFTTRRGRPLVVYSDNGTQIVAGNKEIQEGIERLKEQNIVGQMVKQEIEWHFSHPSAPHFGGVWESLVRSAKVALEVIVESRPLTEELLRGFVIQAESLLNGRPLTHVSGAKVALAGGQSLRFSSSSFSSRVGHVTI
jgi:transposase InsO family protein